MRLALLLLYALLSTGLLPALLDEAVSIESRRAASADFPCAGHGCGCEPEECRKSCCCFPVQDAGAKQSRRGEAPASGSMRLLIMSRCAGGSDDAIASRAHVATPHLSSQRPGVHFPQGRRLFVEGLPLLRPAPDLDPPSQVPRSRTLPA